MPQRETAAPSYVARVRRARGIAHAQRLRHGGIADDPSPSAIANSLIFLIPSGGRKPNFDLDIRVAGRTESRGDAAKGRQIGEGIQSLVLAVAVCSTGRRKLARCDYLGRSDRGI